MSCNLPCTFRHNIAETVARVNVIKKNHPAANCTELNPMRFNPFDFSDVNSLIWAPGCVEPEGTFQMTDLFTLLTLAASLAAVVLLVLLLKRSGSSEAELARIEGLERVIERSERSLRDELARLREELAQQSRDGRAEQNAALQSFGNSLLRRMTEIAALQKSQLDTFAEQLKTLTLMNEGRLEKLRDTVEAR